MKKTTLNAFSTYFLIIVLFVAVRIISGFGLLSFLGESASYIMTAVVQIGLLFCLSIFMFSGLQKQKVKTTFKFYGYKKISFKAVIIAVVLGAVVYFLNIYVASFFDSIIKALGYTSWHTSSDPESYPIYMLLVNLVFTAALPAICEETVHRGMLQKSQSNLGSVKAVVITALLFGLLHLNIEQFFYATIIGLFVGYLAIICDSIYPAMIIHFMNNALSVFAGFSAFHKLPFARALSAVFSFLNNGVLGYLFIFLLFITLVYVAYLLVRMLFIETTGKTMMHLQKELYKELAKTDYMAEVRDAKTLAEGGEASEEKLDLEELYIDKNIKMGLMTELDSQLLAQSGKYKLSKLERVLMFACFFLTAGCTIFSFIWGVL